MRPRHVLALALFAAGGARVQAADLNVITGVEVKDQGATVVIEVKGSKPPNFTTFSMADPPRFVIDLSEAKFQGVPEDMPVNDATILIVKNLSYGSDATSIARVMVAFVADVDPPDVQAAGNTLVVRVTKPAGAPLVAAAPPAAEKARADAEAQAKADAERRAQAEAAARAEAERKAQEEAQARAEAEKKAQEAAAVAKAREESDAQRKAQEAADAKARAEIEAEARAEAERKAGEQASAQAKADAERRAQEAADEAARREVEAQARADAEKKAREEAQQGAAAAERKAQEEAQAAAEQKSAEEARREEARRAKEDKERQRQEALAAAKSDAERKKLEAQQRREEEQAAKEQARLAREEEKRRKAEEAQAAKEAEKQRREEERLAKLAAKDEAKLAREGEAQLAAAAPSAQLREVGFRQMPGASRVFVRTTVTPRFTIQDLGNDTVRVELQNTQVKRRNDTRFLDTSFFPSAVAMISPSRRGSTYVVDIKLKQKVPYQQKIEGDMLAIDFERPGSAAPAPGAEPPAAAGELNLPPPAEEKLPPADVPPAQDEPRR